MRRRRCSRADAKPESPVDREACSRRHTMFAADLAASGACSTPQVSDHHKGAFRRAAPSASSMVCVPGCAYPVTTLFAWLGLAQ